MVPSPREFQNLKPNPFLEWFLLPSVSLLPIFSHALCFSLFVHPAVALYDRPHSWFLGLRLMTVTPPRRAAPLLGSAASPISLFTQVLGRSQQGHRSLQALLTATKACPNRLYYIFGCCFHRAIIPQN
ncbi:hypothetical protein I3760_16G118600 [Carya illinoinensis]|nr:hypothetical protein I3760_16G118600 [Carya illinoinensis]